ncbi:MAG TPA: cupin domain-containing protein [Mycobacteriales bacterium]|jgi:mannose-6-phosphate isomerase-like protein (cupin superfamily)|nr:cupin domain-containing protein [Mycobacteriales bacterium]
MAIHVVRPDDGEQSGGGPIRCRIIEDGSHTGHRLGLIEAVVPPGPAGPPQHIHREHDEVFIVTRGTLRFGSGDDSVDVAAGGCVTVPSGTPHTFSNPFDEPATFICTLTPDLYVDYFRDLGKLPTDGNGQLNPPDIGRTMAKYATEVTR